ncbi:50S ribosomal protein L13 [Candidatus Microgenomates bacterium]|nr:50S ribosomal protein L13 [Candidatus Microgenomates bacterium]
MLKRTNSTKSAKEVAIVRRWKLIDVNGKILGREASRIARMLQGTDKATYSPNLDGGDYVVVLNAQSVKLTGRKEQVKTYDRYSGYPGGRTVKTAARMRETRPTELIRHAVSGMLPKNKLRSRRLARLFVFPDANHTHGDKFETKNS